MAIIHMDYNENTDQINRILEEYTKEKLPAEILDTVDNPELEMELQKEHTEKKIALAYQDESGIIGRIAGHIDYGFSTLKIDLFAVEKAARRKGVGHQLLSEMERIGKEEGCIAAFVETVNFSAPGFYEKEGYTLLGKIDDFPINGIAYYWFYKKFPGDTRGQ